MSIFSEENVSLLLFQSYLAAIQNSVGSSTFRNFYADMHGRAEDILEDGNLSCAYFVSSILRMFGWIGEVHSEVTATVDDMQKSGWRRINEPVVGAVLVWEAKVGSSGNAHRHIGFYIGGKRAISNDDKTGQPQEHHYTYDDTRNIELVFWNDALEN